MAAQDPIPDDEDPLLVRPYISPDPAATGPTWPSAAAQQARPAGDLAGADLAGADQAGADQTSADRAGADHAGAGQADATVAIELPPTVRATSTGQPRRGAAPQSRDHRRVLLFAGAGLAAVLALAGAGFAALRPDDPGPAPVAAPPAVSAFISSAPAPSPSAAPSPTTRAPAPPAATAAAPPPAATTTTAGSPATTTATTTRPPSSPASAAPTLSLAPAVARTGTLVGAGGLCLDLNGGVPVDGNHVQVFTCNGSDAQRWTLATDGTLRAVGRCAQVTGDATVHIIGCDARPAAQWRAGPGRSLVNGARCLTDPRSGAAPGTGVVLAPCTGGPGQRWSLP